MMRRFVLSVACSLVSADIHRLGPGRGEWAVGDPAEFGLKAEALEAAAKSIATRTRERYCFLVVKD